jgi:hypothetical protein
MTQQEIKNEIAKYNQIIEDHLTPNHFVLNQTTKNAIEQITKLQKQCAHEFDNGVCIWCGLMEEK